MALADLIRTRARQGGANQRSLRELQLQVAELERMQKATGAPLIEQEQPGAMRTIIDILSRPNYAVAGLAEELLSGNGVMSGVARTLQEIFSGVGELQGEKRAFGEVLERLGTGTVTLADAFPALEGTWVGALGSRGAAGIALDIATDPLTYVTFGTASGFRVALKGARKALSKNGEALYVQAQKNLQVALKESLQGLTDPQDIIRAYDTYEVAVGEEFLKLAGASTVADLPKQLLDPGGFKFLGKSVITNDALRSVGSNIESVARATLGPQATDSVIEGSRAFAEGISLSVKRIFHPFNELAVLPKELREPAIELRRRFITSRGAVHTRMMRVLDEGLVDRNGTQIIGEKLGRRYRDLERSDPNIGRKFYELREGTKVHRLTPAQAEVYEDYVRLHDIMADTLVHADVLKPEQIKAGYFFHKYENVDDLRTYHWNLNRSGNTPKLAERMEKERVFDSYAETERVSRELNAATTAAAIDARMKGEAARIYPILKPDYDLLSNTQDYIGQYADALARESWRQEVLEKFGIDIIEPEWQARALFDISDPVLKATHKHYAHDRALIFNIMEDQKDNLRGVEARLTEGFWGEPKARGDKSITELMDVLKRRLGGVKGAVALKSEEGRKELVRQVVLSTEHSSQFAQVVLGLKKAKLDKYLPDMRGTISNADAEKWMLPFAKEGAEYGAYRGGWWGDSGVMIPKAIATDIEEINSKALGIAKRDFTTLLRGFDWLNNTFKLGVYTFWPASAVRDAYSNVALSMLDIGWGALDPKMHFHASRLVGALGAPTRGGVRRKLFRNLQGQEFKTKRGITYSMQDLVLMAEDLGVMVPGEVFAELTGDPTKVGVLRRTLKTGAHYRGLIENEARVQLWLNWINRGLTPREAADRVGQFLFNYGELSAVERELFRRFIPFYTFTRKNIELQAKMLMRKPGLVLNQTKPFRGREEENEWMVKWEGEGLKIRLDGDGKSVWMINGVDLPLRNLDTIWAGGVGPTGRRMMGMVTPFLKVPIEVMAGTDFFTGGRLKRAYGPTLGRMVEHAPTGVKNWLGYKKTFDEGGRPIYTFDGARYSILVKSWAFSRVFSTTDRQFREYADDPTIAAGLLDMLTGLRAKDVNMNEQQRRKLHRRSKQLEDSLVRRGALVSFTKAFTPANERAQLQ